MKVRDEHDIILRPVVTEKSTDDGEHGKYSFMVRKDATKPQIKAASVTAGSEIFIIVIRSEGCFTFRQIAKSYSMGNRSFYFYPLASSRRFFASGSAALAAMVRANSAYRLAKRMRAFSETITAVRNSF